MDSLTGGEYGFLLLTSHLGDPERKPLTVAQVRELFRRSENMNRREESGEVEVNDFISMGYSHRFAQHVLDLLGDEILLRYYLGRAGKAGCVPITRASKNYPPILRKRLGLESPGCLWARGDTQLLNTPMVSLVGSRDLLEDNRAFAAEVGRQAALQGYTLVSGNARGADRTAQNACLASGGKVISVVADALASQPQRENILYLSEDGFDEAFSAQRALSRNRIIHALGLKTFVAQCSLGTGGTWDGTVKNLQHGWSNVYCFRDGSEAAVQLEQMGANLINTEDLVQFDALPESEYNIFDL